jgi:predicted SnoaL-like aldol condensation-catalyzing enzyme
VDVSGLREAPQVFTLDRVTAITDDPLSAWLRLWNGRLDLLTTTVHPHFRAYVPGQDPFGRATLHQIIESVRTQFDVFSVKIDVGPIRDGDLTAGRWTAVAVTAGESSYWVGQSILRLEEGLIREHWEINAQLRGKPFPLPQTVPHP